MRSDELNTEQAAVYVDHTESTMRTWRCRGLGPVFYRIGLGRGRIRYRRADLDAWRTALTTRVDHNVPAHEPGYRDPGPSQG